MVIGIITAFNFQFKRCIAQMQLNLLELCVARMSWSLGVFTANQPTQLMRRLQNGIVKANGRPTTADRDGLAFHAS